MAFCTNCGTKIEDNMKFCPNCGASLEEDPQPSAPPPVSGSESHAASKAAATATSAATAAATAAAAALEKGVPVIKAAGRTAVEKGVPMIKAAGSAAVEKGVPVIKAAGSTAKEKGIPVIKRHYKIIGIAILAAVVLLILSQCAGGGKESKFTDQIEGSLPTRSRFCRTMNAICPYAK